MTEQAPDWATFGARLQYALDLKRKDRKALAAVLRSPSGELGVTPAAIGQVLSGQTRAMNAENAARAARYLGVDCYWLSTGEGEPGEQVLTAAELRTIDALRTIAQMNIETHEQIVAEVDRVADGLIATHAVLSGHGVTGYVTPKRAAEKLKAPTPKKRILR